MPVASEIEPVEVFFSYSHQDETLRDELAKHLSILQRSSVIDAWHDREITAGTEWADEIDAHLNSARVILLLVSPDFMASDYCYDIELKRAMARHRAREACVIPIILRSVDWRGAPFGKLQSLPHNGKAVTSWTNRDDAFFDVAQGIRKAIKDLTKARREVYRKEAIRQEVIRKEAIRQEAIRKEAIIRRIRQSLSIAKSHQALEQTLSEVEAFRERYPTNPEGQRLKDQILRAIYQERGRLLEKRGSASVNTSTSHHPGGRRLQAKSSGSFTHPILDISQQAWGFMLPVMAIWVLVGLLSMGDVQSRHRLGFWFVYGAGGGLFSGFIGGAGIRADRLFHAMGAGSPKLDAFWSAEWSLRMGPVWNHG